MTDNQDNLYDFDDPESAAVAVTSEDGMEVEPRDDRSNPNDEDAEYVSPRFS